MNRPTGVTVLAILVWIAGALSIIGGLVTFASSAFLASIRTGPMAGLIGALGAAAGIVLLVLGIIHIVTGVGLWKLLNWGRILCMIFVVLGLLSKVWGLINVLIHFSIGWLIWQAIVCAIELWILIYLNKPHVKRAFGQSA